MFNILYHLFHPHCKQQCSVTLKRTIDEKFSRRDYYVPKVFKYQLLSRCRHDSNASPFTSECFSKVGECVAALCVPSSHQNKPHFFSFLFVSEHDDMMMMMMCAVVSPKQASLLLLFFIWGALLVCEQDGNPYSSMSGSSSY